MALPCQSHVLAITPPLIGDNTGYVHPKWISQIWEDFGKVSHPRPLLHFLEILAVTCVPDSCYQV